MLITVSNLQLKRGRPRKARETDSNASTALYHIRPTVIEGPSNLSLPPPSSGPVGSMPSGPVLLRSREASGTVTTRSTSHGACTVPTQIRANPNSQQRTSDLAIKNKEKRQVLIYPIYILMNILYIL